MGIIKDHETQSLYRGGISGLTVLHYLKQRFGETVEITLFEKEPTLGDDLQP